ncbi:MAG: winged helix-turn-helix transcriptional regulator [Pseudomonadota bacterium]
MHHLLHLELVERNAGHGHPLRPEFRVTSRGAAMAEMAHRILSQVREADHLLLRKSWTLPVLAVVREPQFFGGLRQQLVPVTDRALSLALRGLEAKNWVERVPLQELRPMRPSYSAVGVGLAIAQDLNRYLSRQ